MCKAQEPAGGLPADPIPNHLPETCFPPPPITSRHQKGEPPTAGTARRPLLGQHHLSPSEKDAEVQGEVFLVQETPSFAFPYDSLTPHHDTPMSGHQGRGFQRLIPSSGSGLISTTSLDIPPDFHSFKREHSRHKQQRGLRPKAIKPKESRPRESGLGAPGPILSRASNVTRRNSMATTPVSLFLKT